MLKGAAFEAHGLFGKNRMGMYACRFCGRVEAKPLALCPNCGTWGSFLPFGERDLRPKASFGPASFGLLDGILGKVPPSTVFLLSGEPGVGKSTLALHVAGKLAFAGPVLYVCAEEKTEAVRERAARIGVCAKNLTFLEERLVGRILRAAEGHLGLVVDSLPMVTTRASLSPAGAAAQRQSAVEFVRFAREAGVYVFLVTHVAKRGLSGPKMVEHLVDVVLILTKSADGQRMLRVTKNRHGPASRALFLEMTPSGLLPLEAKS